MVAGAQNAEVSNLGSSFARTSAPSVAHEVVIGFANNSSQLDTSYGENAIALREISEYMRVLLSGVCSTHAIIIEGAASPLGNEEYNKRLALRRAQVVRDFLRAIDGSDRIRIHAISNGEDWESFAREIIANYNRPNRDEVIAIIRSNLSNDEKEAKLRSIDKSGETFRILVQKHMTSARNAALIRIVELEELKSKLKPPTLDVSAIRATMSPQVKSASAQKEVSSAITTTTENATNTANATNATVVAKDAAADRKLVVAARSNLLVPALNVGVEVPIGTNWSVGADYYFPWVWPKKDNKNCFEFLGWGIEGRYWFGKNRTIHDRLQGHSVGLYGYMGYYDFERNFHGHQGEFVNVGLDYTYAMAVGKKKAVHFEFSLGVGFIYSEARKYTVIEATGPLISDKITQKVRYFGPTKANISLVVPIFQKVKPNDKNQHGNE